MESITKFIAAILIASVFCACGVDDPSGMDTTGKAPDMEGDWQLVLVPLEGDCPLLSKGLAIHSPLNIPDVKQDGNNISAAFTVSGTDYILTGNIVFGYLIAAMQSAGVFIETIGADADTPIFSGTFNGTEPTGGCSEMGVFIGATRPFAYPVVTGEWTITLTGTSSDCEDISDEGDFEKILPGITATSPLQGAVTATYQDPAGVVNILTGAAAENRFIAGIYDISVPPARIAYLDGKIDENTDTISGKLEGLLAFPGGDCTVKGTFGISY